MIEKFRGSASIRLAGCYAAREADGQNPVKEAGVTGEG